MLICNVNVESFKTRRQEANLHLYWAGLKLIRHYPLNVRQAENLRVSSAKSDITTPFALMLWLQKIFWNAYGILTESIQKQPYMMKNCAATRQKSLPLMLTVLFNANTCYVSRLQAPPLSGLG